jgi:hypothetical protein
MGEGGREASQQGEGSQRLPTRPVLFDLIAIDVAESTRLVEMIDPTRFAWMRFGLECPQAKPLLPSSRGPRRHSAGIESALNWTRCGQGSHSQCKVEDQPAVGSPGTDK